MKRAFQAIPCILATTLALLFTMPANARELVVAEVHSSGHVIVKAEELFASRLAELTKGEVTIQLKNGGQLGSEVDAWNNVRNGSLDIARINTGGLAADVASAKLLSLPYLFRSRDHMWRTLGGDFGKQIATDVEKTGAVVLTYYDSGSRSFYSAKKLIRNRSDFKGQRIRVQNSAIYKDLITVLGGVPVVVDYNKVVDAFKKGEIDGAENNLTSYVSSDHYKYARFYSLDEHSSVPEVLLMSKKVWDSLTPEQQQAAMKAAAESSEYMKRLWAEAEAQSLATAKKEGVTIIDRSQMSMDGIEEIAIKLYTKHLGIGDDLQTVMNIVMAR